MGMQFVFKCSSRQWRHCRSSSNWICPLWFCFLAVNAIVFYTAVVCVVTQRSLWPGKLCNDKNNGCVADYKFACFNYNSYNFTVILVSDSLLRVLGDCDHQPKWNYQVSISVQVCNDHVFFSFQCCPSSVKNGDVEKRLAKNNSNNKQGIFKPASGLCRRR